MTSAIRPPQQRKGLRRGIVAETPPAVNGEEGMLEFFRDTRTLRKHISGALYEKAATAWLYPPDIAASSSTSSVLFLLGAPAESGSPGDSCVILNKRSGRVRQPGDLCFPGGRIAPRLDGLLSRFMNGPLSLLGRWPYWPRWRAEHGKEETERLRLIFATALRESVEEMRLNPFGLTFLGPMPSQDLSMFRRVLYPMVGWVNRQKRFFPNWEVEKIVRIPLKSLLEPDGYASYRIQFVHRDRGSFVQDFPCFLHDARGEREILWGVTYRIVTAFLESVFAFRPPSMGSLPVIQGRMNETYLHGAP